MKMIIKILWALLLIVLISCKSDEPDCWTCTREVYKNGEALKDAWQTNTDCDLEDETANEINETPERVYSIGPDNYLQYVRCRK